MTAIAPVLAYDVRALPATTATAARDLLAGHGLAAEVSDDGTLDVSFWVDSGVPVAAVQAYRLHDVHPLHPDPDATQAALDHVRHALEAAHRLGARHVVTVCGFGHVAVDRPMERCHDFFAALTEDARSLGVRVLVEPLSPVRAGAMTDPAEIAALVDGLDAPDVFGVMLDTGHLADSGTDPGAFFASWGRSCEEVQVRGPGSAPPRADLPLDEWLGHLPAAPAVVCIEHRLPISETGVAELVGAYRRSLRLDAAV